MCVCVCVCVCVLGEGAPERKSRWCKINVYSLHLTANNQSELCNVMMTSPAFASNIDHELDASE